MSKFDVQVLSVGEILQHDFGKQTANFRAIHAVLKRHGLYFQEMEISVIPGKGRAKNTQFVTFRATAPGLIWHKYECGSAGAGQNHVLIHGRRFKTSEFLKWSPEKQDEVMRSPTIFKDQQAARKAANKAALERFEPIARQEGWTYTVENERSGKKVLTIRLSEVDGTNFRAEWKRAENWRDAFLARRGMTSMTAPEAQRQESFAMMTIVKEQELDLTDLVKTILKRGWNVQTGWREIRIQPEISG